MRKLLILFLLPLTAMCQDFSDGMVAVEFNASFNKTNEVQNSIDEIVMEAF